MKTSKGLKSIFEFMILYHCQPRKYIHCRWIALASVVWTDGNFLAPFPPNVNGGSFHVHFTVCLEIKSHLIPVVSAEAWCGSGWKEQTPEHLQETPPLV